MGNFYTNITLRGPDQAAVATFLRQARRAAYVAPRHAGGTTVYDERCEAQDPQLLGELATALSRHFACPALAVLNHDDDILALLKLGCGSRRIALLGQELLHEAGQRRPERGCGRA